MAAEAGLDLGHGLALLAAGVAAVPLSRWLGLGSVLGYLAAGLAIGPYGLGLFSDPETLLHVAELGVVLFLFLIGLEMRPTRLWALRRAIFGLGVAQVGLASLLLSLAAWAAGAPLPVAVIGAFGFVLSSTAVIMQLLEERGLMGTKGGQQAVSILLLEDLAIVPLLALVAAWGAALGGGESESPWRAIGLAVAALAGVLAVGRWLLDPMFRLLARSGAREVMTAAALMVVLGAAFAMELGGLSMAMGAFLAGVLLSDSSFRHQLEADVEPFRGILLGLFFLSVGMALDLGVVAAQWRVVLGGVLAAMALKSAAIYAVARATGSDHDAARGRALLFAQGGEFAFVLYAAASGNGLIDGEAQAALTAIVILSMALTPLLLLAEQRLVKPPEPSLDGVDAAEGLSGRVLMVGFGRFAQVVSQPLLARGVDLSIIENDVEMIQAAGNFGFKVYYGDGTRLDVLRASGAETAEAILVCVDKPDAADRIVELARAEFPLARLMVRAFDRGHVLRLVEAGVDYQIRETLESAMTFGARVLEELGFEDVEDTMADVRQRDDDRLDLQLAGGLKAGRALMRGNMATPQPAPLTVPSRRGRALNEDAAAALDERREDA